MSDIAGRRRRDIDREPDAVDHDGRFQKFDVDECLARVATVVGATVVGLPVEVEVELSQDQSESAR